MSIEMMLIFFVVIILFRESFLYGYRTSDRILRTRKGTHASAFCVTGAICYANNQALLAHNLLC